MENNKLRALKTICGIFGCLVSAVAIWLLVEFSLLPH